MFWRGLTIPGKLLLVLAFSLAALSGWLAYTSVKGGGRDAIVAPAATPPAPEPTATAGAKPSPEAPQSTPTRDLAPSPTATRAPAPTATPTTNANVDLDRGSPLTAADIVAAWAGGGLGPEVGETAASYDGIGTRPVHVILGDDSGTAEVDLLVYASFEGASRDWQLALDEAPEPEAGVRLPPHEAVWWNSNVIAVVLGRSGDISGTALDLFLEPGP